MNTILHYIRTMSAPDGADGPDREYLDRFGQQGDQAAFAVLVRRYAACVWSVCRRVLDREQDAEDAFQATFLTLARKAGSIRRRDSLPAWLHGVARRISANLRRNLRRHAEREAEAASCPRTGNEDLTWQEGMAILDDELARLPEHYRAVLIVCCLDGRTRDEAAIYLGCSQGQVKGRLERARELLRRRLERRGVQLGALLLAAGVSRASAGELASAALVRTTIDASLSIVSNSGSAGMVSPRVVMLAKGLERQLKGTMLRFAAAALVMLGLVALGSGQPTRQNPAAQQGQQEPTFLDEKADDRGVAADAKDREPLQGTWRVESMRANGITTDNFRGARTLLIKGDCMHWQDNEPPEGARQFFTLQASSKPASIDLRQTHRAKIMAHGIYQVDGDTLKLCWNSRPTGKAPGTFQESEGIWLLVLKRQKQGPGKPEAVQPTTAEKELERFQGTWVLVTSEQEGKVKSEEKNPYRFTITGNRWKVHRGEEVAVHGTIKLVDVAARPKQFNLLKPPRLSPIPTVDYGIYELKGDTLRYCVRNGPAGAGVDTADLRPREFVTREGDSRTIYLWKRAKGSGL